MQVELTSVVNCKCFCFLLCSFKLTKHEHVVVLTGNNSGGCVSIDVLH